MSAPIAIVGSGAVAQALGRVMSSRGEPVVAVASRTPSHAERAATFIGGSAKAVPMAELPRVATRVLIAVADEGITPVAETLARAGLQSGLALHTCGARGPEALAPLAAAGLACGMLHPLQTIVTPEQGVKSLERVTFGLAGDADAMEWAEHIVALFGGHPLRLAADGLSWYHAGAVMASNAIAAVIEAAVELLMGAGIDRDVALRAVGPLSRTSLENTLDRGPERAATGPVMRGDAGTVAAHMAALTSAPPAVAALYVAAARQLVELARRRGLPQSRVDAVMSVLDGRQTEEIDGRHEGPRS